MAFMADFARMPTSRKVLVFVVIGGLTGALYYQFVFKSLGDDLDAAEAEYQGKLAINATKDRELEDYKTLKVKYPKLVRTINEYQKALPTEAEVGAFFETINRKIDESGAQLQRSKEEPEAPVEQFVKVPVTFEMTGTFLQIKRFFASLQPKKAIDKPEPTANGEEGVEERERIVSIDNLTLTDPSVKSGTIMLTARFTAATFRQEEPKDAPPPGSGPRPPGAAAPPPKPLAPAGTPAGAKQRVENALDKSEKRVDEKVGSDRLKGGI